ncbi:MAG: ferrous iron transport protein A [Candidatus Krumholzibacteria bacterium]|nr:ferrous iron transport protein A [Candidatus Krumholzibacteria bacterium]
MTVALVDIKPGGRGRILEVGGGSRARRRMFDMGVTPGVIVEVKRVAPLGDPIEVKVRGYNLLVRKSEASGITVEVE